ncbi:MAG: hypothetical protein MUF34_21740 [Polyangiaceae bacterium]|jgi:hypothetical protein|nr:hypothetical protein [Polyangiaceae bacterium]
MVNVPRRRKNGKSTPADVHGPPEPPPVGTRAPKLCPVDELEARLAEPEEGPFLHALDRQVIYPTLVTKLTDAGQQIIAVLTEHDSADLWPLYEDLETDLSWARERAAYSIGWQSGSADGRAESFRSQAPGLSKRAKRLADQARALVVIEGLSPVEATALLLETAWSILLTRPAPSFEG